MKITLRKCRLYVDGIQSELNCSLAIGIYLQFYLTQLHNQGLDLKKKSLMFTLYGFHVWLHNQGIGQQCVNKLILFTTECLLKCWMSTSHQTT